MHSIEEAPVNLQGVAVPTDNTSLPANVGKGGISGNPYSGTGIVVVQFSDIEAQFFHVQLVSVGRAVQCFNDKWRIPRAFIQRRCELSLVFMLISVPVMLSLVIVATPPWWSLRSFHAMKL